MNRVRWILISLAFWSSVTLAANPKFIAKAALTMPSAAAAKSGPKSYREWKSDKVKEASDRVERVEGQVVAAHAKGSAPAILRDLDQQLSEEKWNLEIAQDLAVTDYLALYLAQQGGMANLTEAARKLSPEEMAEVMEAYLRTVGTLPNKQAIASPAAALIGH